MRRDPSVTRADDEDEEEFWEEKEEVLIPTDALANAPDGPTMLADLLLELTAYTTRLRILLEEAEEGEFKAIVPRYQGFIDEVQRLPTQATKRTPIGFQAPEPKKTRKTAKKKTAPKKSRK